METEFINLELYVSTGTDAIKIASAEVSLKDLVFQNNKEEISAVITTQAFFNGQNNEYMGILNLKFRMRFPIAESINWIQDKRKLGTNINMRFIG